MQFARFCLALFAFTLKFLSDTLNVKNAFGSEIGKTLAVMQKTSGDIQRGLDNYLKSRK